MPRIFFLFMVAACAGCAGGQRAAPKITDSVGSLVTAAMPAKAKLRPVASPQLTAFEPAPCVGERYDDNLIEQESNQPWLRPVNR